MTDYDEDFADDLDSGDPEEWLYQLQMPVDHRAVVSTKRPRKGAQDGPAERVYPS